MNTEQSLLEKHQNNVASATNFIEALTIECKKNKTRDLNTIINKDYINLHIESKKNVDLKDITYVHHDNQKIQELVNNYKCNYSGALTIAICETERIHHGNQSAITFDENNWSPSENRLYLFPGIHTNTDALYVEIHKYTYNTGRGNESLSSDYDAIYNISIKTKSEGTVTLHPAIWFDNSSQPTYDAVSNGNIHTFPKITKENPVFWQGKKYYGLCFKSTVPICKLGGHAIAIIYANSIYIHSRDFPSP